MRTILRFIVGYAIGRVATLVALLVIGLMLVSSTNTPAPERQAIEQQRLDEAAALAYREEEREARYRATLGAPHPVRGWEP
jgi:uncharacterized membrane protein (Fun14 family)